MIPAVGSGFFMQRRQKATAMGDARSGSGGGLELDIRLYKEESVELLSDLYSTGCEVVSEQGVCFDRLLTRNSCKMRVAEVFLFRNRSEFCRFATAWIVRLDESPRQKTVWRSRECWKSVSCI